MKDETPIDQQAVPAPEVTEYSAPEDSVTPTSVPEVAQVASFDTEPATGDISSPLDGSVAPVFEASQEAGSGNLDESPFIGETPMAEEAPIGAIGSDTVTSETPAASVPEEPVQPPAFNMPAAEVQSPIPEATGTVSSTPEELSQGTTPPVKGRGKLLVVGIAVGVLALFGGGGAAAYSLWYQNPDKVLGDALVNMMQAKTVSYTGSFNVKTSDVMATPLESVAFTVKGQNGSSAGELHAELAITYGGKAYSFSGSGMTDKDLNLYVKVNDVQKLLTQALQDSRVVYEELPSGIRDIVAKVDSKWVYISSEDLKDVDESYGEAQQCVSEVVSKLTTDKTMGKELATIYRENQFIVVSEQLPSKDGSLGYVVNGDKDKYLAFSKAANQSQFAKELQECDDSFKLDEEESTAESGDSAESRIEIWVDRWSHQLTKIHATSSDDEASGELLFEPVFNQPANVEIPKEYVKLSELKDMLQQALNDLGLGVDAKFGDTEDSSADFSATGAVLQDL